MQNALPATTENPHLSPYMLFANVDASVALCSALSGTDARQRHARHILHQQAGRRNDAVT
ncbi:MAG: hypothetical protein JXA33_16660 [Anaerolineae bacterium]|nr:hypothetical protein [Anaerolineae bacterium]